MTVPPSPDPPAAPATPTHTQGSPAAPVRVVLVDDEALIRAGLAAIINAQPDLEVVGEAGDGVHAVSLIRRLTPQVVLMDVRMPGLDGIQTTRQLLASMASPPRILVVTTFEHDDYVYGALQAGAAGFLLKRATPTEITHAIRLAATGDSLLFPAAIRNLAAHHAPHQPAAPAPWHGQLTDREADVLRLVAAGHTNAEIAQALVVSLETVKTHVGNLLTKLGVRDRTQAVIAAYETGFITPHQQPHERP
jgi:DNA-binding NarL/FixJ family response regulator